MIHPQWGRNSLFLFLCTFCILGILNAQRTESLAVLDLEGRGISTYETASLTDRLRSELVKTVSVTVVDRGQMQQILAEQNFQLTGCTSNECAIEVGQLLGVTHMIAGSIGKVGSTFSIDVRKIDVKTGRIIQSVIRDYQGKIDGLLAEMAHVAWELVEFYALEEAGEQLPSIPKPEVATKMESQKHPLFGQNPNGQPDSVRIVPDLPPIMMLPVWDPPGGYLPVGAAPDTLYFEYPALVPERSTWLKGQRWLGIGMVVLFGSLSFHCHQEAEATYKTYLTSGNPTEIDDLFDKTQRLDRLAGWCYLGVETGLILVAFSFVLGP